LNPSVIPSAFFIGESVSSRYGAAVLNPLVILSAFFIGEPVSSPYGVDVLNPSVIPSACSSMNRSRRRTKLTFLNPSVIPSVQNTRNNLHVSEPPFFFLILNIPSINTDELFLSVYADDLIDRLNYVGNGDLKLPTELFRRKFCWY